MPAFYEWTVRIQLPNTVVARGGTIDREEILDHLIKELGANGDEEDKVKVMVTKAPSEETLRREQQ